MTTKIVFVHPRSETAEGRALWYRECAKRSLTRAKLARQRGYMDAERRSLLDYKHFRKLEQYERNQGRQFR